MQAELVKAMQIGDVARETGLSQSAIRYYEAEGLLSAPKGKSGWRVFQSDVVDRLRVIRMARDMSFSLDEIRTLLDGFSAETPPSARWQHLARRKLPEVEEMLSRAAAIKGLLEKGLRCDCVSVKDCLTYNCDPPALISRRER
jgi:MerR family redox-sensitive transcriptional activator SoxR